MAATSTTLLTTILTAAALLVAVVACQKQNTTPASADALTALPPAVPAAADNPASPAKVALGQALF